MHDGQDFHEEVRIIGKCVRWRTICLLKAAGRVLRACPNIFHVCQSFYSAGWRQPCLFVLLSTSVKQWECCICSVSKEPSRLRDSSPQHPSPIPAEYHISMSQPHPHVNPLMNLTNSIVSGGTYIQHITVQNGESAGYTRLLGNVAASAMHDSIQVVDPPKCHPNTRVAIMQSIIDWAKGVADAEINQKSIIWLNGGAGAGKSAIARSVAERCNEQGLLLGSFFFAARDATRNHVGGLVATICYQMCKVLPGFRDMVSLSISNDPLIFKSSISTQLATLVINPLSSTISANHLGKANIPLLIIIDGLDECSKSTEQKNVDECGGTMDQKSLLLALQEATRSMPHVRFLVCSRPENHINAAFGLPRMSGALFKIFLGDDYAAHEDIRLYLEDKFKEIKNGHVFKHTLPATWPTAQTIGQLLVKSSGQFIYASTVIRYIESPRHRPHQRLEALFNLRPAFKDLPFTQLDALYRHIITQAGNPSKVLDIIAFTMMYGCFLCRFPAIEALLQLEEGDVEVTVRANLQSIVTIEPTSGSISLLHRSLEDFLRDPQRAGDLYRDRSAVVLQHVAGSISISVPTPSKYESSCIMPIIRTISDIGRLKIANHVANYVCSDIVQAAKRFPMFEFIKGPLLLHDGSSQTVSGLNNQDVRFVKTYLIYLCAIRDVSAATSLVYMDQIHQYCTGVLSVLKNNFSNDWEAHHFYGFYFLFPSLPRWKPKRFPSMWNLNLPQTLFYDYLCGGYKKSGCRFHTFAHTIDDLMRVGASRPEKMHHGTFTQDVIGQTFQELLKGRKKEAILAKSAAFCLTVLCDKRRSGPAWCISDSIMRIDPTDQRKRREHPWRWRQLSSRRRLLHDPLVIVVQTNPPKYRLHPLGWPPALKRLSKAGDPLPNTNSVLVLSIHKDRQPPCLHTDHRKLIFPPQAGIVKDYELGHYLLSLKLLPLVLSRAGRYDPLVELCRNKSFAPTSQLWPKQSRRARQAIAAYLQRVDPHEDISVGKHTGHSADPSRSMVVWEFNASEGKGSNRTNPSGGPSFSLQSHQDGGRPEVQERIQIRTMDSHRNTLGDGLGFSGDAFVSSQRREDVSESWPEEQEDIRPFNGHSIWILFFSVLLLLFSVFIVI
ncbi:hypothetical protein D9613_009760 [Agrocybe pediades]|uniref:Nephrocystin 3-like N-terminal domain-containing protein n=1 Tax=Agrocybe pediades TaxID=84607 RepID=A0A8H4VQM7_9AGAR|nr:hypothetical protein D9613_009760 [Agrocybe pediades]